MRTDEVKLRIKNFIENTIDLYMPPHNFFDKLKNSTAKLWLDQNMWRINKVIDAFGDERNEIELEKIKKHYIDNLFENGEMRLDVKSMIPSQYDWIKEYLPNKIVLFKEDDFYEIFK
jgi:hypothetical protein